MRVTPHPHQYARPTRDQTTAHQLCRPPVLGPGRAHNAVLKTRHRLATPTALRTVSRAWTNTRRQTVTADDGTDADGVMSSRLVRRLTTPRVQPAFHTDLPPAARKPGSSIRGDVRLPSQQQKTQAPHVWLRLCLPVLRPCLELTT